MTEYGVAYRHIRCTLGDNSVWEHLLDNPELLERVHELEIEADYDDLSSSENGSDISDSCSELEASEQLLITVLSRLVNLESFVWNRSVINQGEDILGDENGSRYEKDIWTTLRDDTRITKLKVVDWGRATFKHSRPILETTIFTLRNLTDVDLMFIYSPYDPKEGEAVDDSDDFDLIPGRVHIEGLQDLLKRCPNLESLSLTILDQDFYDHGGNPYTTITSIISSNFWPFLKVLKLQDVLIDTHRMGDFLVNHRALRHLSASLSLPPDDHLPCVPFDFPNYNPPLTNFLPYLETIYLPQATLRKILYHIKRPSPINRIGILEPPDWNSSEELENDENYVLSLDDVWGEGEALEDTEIPGGSPTQESPPMRNLLSGIGQIRSIIVKDVTRPMQLSRLVRATPNLESVIFLGNFIDELYDHPAPHIDVLPYLSQWKSLAKIKGCILWPRGEEIDIKSDKALEIAKEIVQACPNLQSVTYDGHTVKFIRGDEGGMLSLEWANGIGGEGEESQWFLS